MTEEQQLMVTDSMWVVNTVLKKLKQDKNEDLRQLALLYMCKCCIKYDPNMGVKWTTYAYKSVLLFCQRTLKKEQFEEKHIFRKLQAMDILKDRANPEPEIEVRSEKMELLIKKCPELAQKIIKLKLKGYRVKEIQKILNIKFSQYRVTYGIIKEKSKEI